MYSYDALYAYEYYEQCGCVLIEVDKMRAVLWLREGNQCLERVKRNRKH